MVAILIGRWRLSIEEISKRKYFFASFWSLTFYIFSCYTLFGILYWFFVNNPIWILFWVPFLVFIFRFCFYDSFQEKLLKIRIKSLINPKNKFGRTVLILFTRWGQHLSRTISWEVLMLIYSLVFAVTL